MREAAYKAALGYKHRRTDAAVNLLFGGIVCVACCKLHLSASPSPAWQLAGLWALQVLVPCLSSCYPYALPGDHVHAIWPCLTQALLLGQVAFLALACAALHCPHFWARQREPLQTSVLLFQIWLSRRAALPCARSCMSCLPAHSLLVVRSCDDMHTACPHCLHRRAATAEPVHAADVHLASCRGTRSSIMSQPEGSQPAWPDFLVALLLWGPDTPGQLLKAAGYTFRAAAAVPTALIHFMISTEGYPSLFETVRTMPLHAFEYHQGLLMLGIGLLLSPCVSACSGRAGPGSLP